MEPIEQVVVDVPEAYSGVVIQKLGARKGDMINMVNRDGSVRLEYEMPTRGLLGLRSEFMTDTRGEGTLSHNFLKFGPHRGEISRRSTGSIVSGETGTTMAYALDGLQQRGPLFIGPGVEVYEGMILGESLKGDNMAVNPLKGKKLTNMRASGSDDAIQLTPPIEMNLERALEYIDSDEYVEVTPKSVRMRKKHLKETDRKRADR